MKLQVSLPLLTAVFLGGVANAGTIVRWYGCNNEYQQTITGADGSCTNISGFKETNLCGVWVPPPGTDRCEFYTTGCFVPGGTTYTCSVRSGRCDTRDWKALKAYRCWT